MEWMRAEVLAFFSILFTTSKIAFASDSSQLQNYCVGTSDPKNAVFVNGIFCKNPSEVVADDFYFKGINDVRNNIDITGSINVTQVNANNMPGLNTLGISMEWANYKPGGLAPPHFHTRSSEIITVLQGTLNVGFVASDQLDQSNKLFAKVLYPGDVFVFPQGLIHYMHDPGEEHTVTVAAFSTRTPRLIRVANALFSSSPAVSADILSKAFHLDEKIVKNLQSSFD